MWIHFPALKVSIALSTCLLDMINGIWKEEVAFVVLLWNT